MRRFAEKLRKSLEQLYQNFSGAGRDQGKVHSMRAMGLSAFLICMFRARMKKEAMPIKILDAPSLHLYYGTRK